ncbi:MAG: site-specific DNA-methyltransferase [bacterium]|jgi:adenine-specific DNA-methyltransferase
MPRKTKSDPRKPKTKIADVKHIKDKRVNIPTRETEEFAREDEMKPATVLYPRDPDLDPQLVWKGKDEQNKEPLSVKAVPIYIHEKIGPKAIIEDFRRAQERKERRAAGMDLELFADFNGIEFDKMVDFYRHEQNWSNRMILGDSLYVMCSLAEKERLKGKVQMIYIDPPYGIKFGSNWQVSTRKRDVKDGKLEDATREPEQIKAFRDTWELGIHSYLSYLRDRLTVARELLTESGSIFVQIGDENVHLVRCLMDEVFGSENFVSMVSFATTSGFEAKTLSRAGDYLVWYGKSTEKIKYREIYRLKDTSIAGSSGYNFFESEYGDLKGINESNFDNEEATFDYSKMVALGDLQSRGKASEDQAFPYRKRIYRPNDNSHWKASCPTGMERLARTNRIVQVGNVIRYKRYFNDNPLYPLNNLWAEQLSEQQKTFVVQTSTKVIERCLLMTTDPGDLVLDPTCGSGTTAYVAEQWGRRWITIDTSRVALALARTRLMCAKYPYYILSDSPEGLQQEAALGGKVYECGTAEGDIRKGFVYKRVPHVTLKSIANNEEIDVIHAKWQPGLDELRAKINEACKTNWEEWEIPREVPKGSGPLADVLIPEWWETRRKRQKEIDESIARRADIELLYDKPYEDTSKVRVAGPFTVESLSPHRTIAADAERPETEEAAENMGNGQFVLTVIENLKKAGVQNTKKKERLMFSRLEPYAGTYIHAKGEFEEAGKSKTVAVAIGPENGTVGNDLIKDAAKEIMKGPGIDLLIVCGFAFDPYVDQEVLEWGKLRILTARMNMELQMGDALKKTGAGNLFMVFGEPDIEIRKSDGQVTVEIKGLDIYDPTTGQIKNNSTDDIAAWFIDTDYNGESFFVRHAYFCGADRPYEKLKRALRAEIDESAWEQLYSTVSRPFDAPKSGKIAVKVINHYGDEVLKVYEV